MQTNFTRWIGLLILLGVCAAAALLLIPVAAPAPVATQVPVAAPVQAYPPPVGGTPLPTLVYAYPPPGSTQSAAMRVPLCQFQGAATAPEVNAVALEDYVFSEPRVVLTHTEGIRIARWLPDNQRLLITRGIPGQPDETIETFNVQTSEITLLGTRRAVDGFNPIWLENEQAVLFQSWQVDGTMTLQKIQASTKNLETLAVNLDYSEISVSPNEQNIVFFTNSEKTSPNFANLDVSQTSTGAFQLPAMYGRETGRHIHSYFQSTWSPDGSRIAFYRNHGFFLANPVNGDVCEVGFDDPMTWAYFARWSSNGRFLAMMTTTSLNAPLQSTDLTVLDTITGEIRTIQIPPNEEISGQRYVTDFDWLSNDTLLILDRIGYRDGVGYDGLFLVNITNGSYRILLPSNEFHGHFGNSLYASPDLSQIVLLCPTISEGRLCEISLTTQQ